MMGTNIMYGDHHQRPPTGEPPSILVLSAAVALSSVIAALNLFAAWTLVALLSLQYTDATATASTIIFGSFFLVSFLIRGHYKRTAAKSPVVLRFCLALIEGVYLVLTAWRLQLALGSGAGIRSISMLVIGALAIASHLSHEVIYTARRWREIDASEVPGSLAILGLLLLFLNVMTGGAVTALWVFLR